MTRQINVNVDAITPSNFRFGNVLLGNDGEQYEVIDLEGKKPVLEKLEPEARNKPVFTQGTVIVQ